jgi:hypothetical protein
MYRLNSNCSPKIRRLVKRKGAQLQNFRRDIATITYKLMYVPSCEIYPDTL